MLTSRPLHDLAVNVLSYSPITIPSHLVSFQVGKTWASEHLEVALYLISYLAIIFGGQWLMQDRKAFTRMLAGEMENIVMVAFRRFRIAKELSRKLLSSILGVGEGFTTKFKPLFMIHNASLSIGSGIVLALMLEEVIPIVFEHGFFYGICNQGSWTARLETLYIINYYFKFWELLDTGFLVIKKKPLQFLHVYHHSATLLLCYVQLHGVPAVSWVPITLNLTVHVLMYYYYFATSAGYKVWWKKYLTTLQITQFVIDLFVVYFASWSYFASEYGGGMLPVMGTCAGSETSAVLGMLLLTSYLFLFVGFYRKTYKKPIAGRLPADKKLQ